MPAYSQSGYSAKRAAPVTPSDSAKLQRTTKYVWVGGAGALSVITEGGNTVTLAGVPAGTLLPIEVQLVRSTGTTATNIVALW